MYLFILYVSVYFIHGVDLRHAPRNLLDGAADTARFINLIQKIGKFEERNPTNNNDEIKDKDADGLEYQAMKLLQKNYDVARKFNERRVRGRNVQHISNPEVLAAYRNLPEEHTEVYDDISDQANTQRSYAEELERNGRLAMHKMRSSRKRNERIPARRLESDDSASDDTDSSNDASEDTRADGNRRTKVDNDADTIENHSKDTKEIHPKSAETLNLLKPIIEQVLSKYSVKLSQEKEGSIETEVKDVSIKEKRKLDEQSHNEDNKKPLNSNNHDDSNETTAVHKGKKNKLGISNKKKDTERLSSNRQKKKKNKNILHKKQSGRIIFTKDEQVITKESGSVSKENILKPRIMKENSKSEEALGDVNEESKKEQTKEFKNKLNTKKYKKKKNMNSESKKKTEKRINKETNSKENENKKTFLDMEETIMDWADYDEDNETDVQHSRKNDEDKSSKSNKSKEGSEKYDKHVYRKKISTRRKGDDNWDDKFEDDNKKTDNDNRSKKKDISKKKDRDWSKDDGSKEDNWNKKDDSWDKKNDADDWDSKNDKSKKKKDNWNKKNDNSDEKDINWDTEEESKVEKNKKWDKDGDTSFKKNKPKRDNAWDNIGTDKKQNSGWGNYDSFKNIKDKTSNKDRDFSRQEKRIPPRIEMKSPKYQSWDRPARDDYYERPRKKQGRQSPFRTSIPFVGKKAVYAD